VILLIGVLFPNKFDPLLPIEVRIAGTGSEIYSDFSRNYYAGDMILYAMIPATIASLAISKKKNQLWRLGLLILLFIWIFRTFFRNYWLTLFTTCIFLIGLICTQDRLRLIKRMIPAVIIGVVIVIGLAVNQPTQVERVLYILTDRLGSLLQDPIRNEGSLQWRAIETRAALEQIRNNPIIGIGLANSYRTPMAGESDAMYSGWASKYVENGYLYITVMMGLLGLIPFLWMCIIYLYRFFRYQNMVQDDCLRPFYLGFGLAFLGMFISNLVVPTFVIGTRLIFFPVSMAINEIIMRLENKRTIK
jgi:O-antigen ligase